MTNTYNTTSPTKNYTLSTLHLVNNSENNINYNIDTPSSSIIEQLTNPEQTAIINNNSNQLSTPDISNLLSNNTNINNILFVLDEPEDRTQEPITSYTDIDNIISYYLNETLRHINVTHNYEKAMSNIRNAMLFICGINMGIRVSDLRQLQFKQLVDLNYNCFKNYFSIKEEKTEKTNRVYINQSVKLIVELFLKVSNILGKKKDIQDYLFVNEASRGVKKYIAIDTSKITSVDTPNKKILQKPLHYNSISPIIVKVCKKLQIVGKHNTHCLRKTFSWGVIQYYTDHLGEDKEANSRALMFLQKRFKHSSTLITEHYTGITAKEDETVCMNLNLGLECIQEWMSKYKNELFT